MTSFGDRLRQALEVKGWRQEDLAERIGGSQKDVSRWVNGRGITLESIQEVLDALGCNANWLLSGRGEPFASPGEAEIRLAAVRHAMAAPLEDLAPTPPVTAEESATLDVLQQVGEVAAELQKADRQKRSAPDNEGAA